MSHNFSKGPQVIGDLKAADDAERNTLIDFGEDQIDFQTSGSVRLQITNDSVKSLTTLKDQSNNEVIGGVSYFDYGLFQNPVSSSNRTTFFPSDDSNIEATSSNTINYNIAPYNGKLMGVTIKTTLNYSATSLTCSFCTGSTSSPSCSATPVTSVQLNGNETYVPHYFDFSQNPNNTINAGEIYSFSLRVDSGFTGTGNFHYIFHMQYYP